MKQLNGMWDIFTIFNKSEMIITDKSKYQNEISMN